MQNSFEEDFPCEKVLQGEFEHLQERVNSLLSCIEQLEDPVMWWMIARAFTKRGASRNGKLFGYYETKKSAQTIIDEFEDDLIWYFTEYIPEVN
jgi:hypothetical protein